MSAPSSRRLSRRNLIAIGGAGAAGLATAGVAGALLRGSSPAANGSTVEAVDFYGEHQAGIVTPAQDRLHFVTFA